MVAQGSLQSELAKKVYARAVLAIPVLMAVFFIPAGTFAYWQAWLYLACLLIPMFFVFRYLLEHDPQLLERRMQTREREPAQQRVMLLSTAYFLLVFILPGLDHRFGWSDVPVLVVLAAEAVFMLGYGLFYRVLAANQFAARTVQVEQGQSVISSGPYALVRHPMYLAVVLMYLASPLALGSYWTLIPAVLIVPILVLRILNEEEVLQRDLPGYRKYQQKTRYRLVPKVW